MATKDPAIYVRLPPDVKAFVANQARLNASSMNSEVVRALRERMEREAGLRPQQRNEDARQG